ncbi:MAG: F0F1 ATP synthase subunit B' [Alphaproteobacteria bacterium]|jgi:F-type H+-transporting ATPase subunit b
MPQLDPSSFASQLVWLTITFVIFYLVMARVALPRVSEVLETRQNRIAYDLETATTLKVEAESVLADYEASMAKAHADSQSLLAQAAQERAGEAARRQEELSAKIAAQLGDAEQRIDAARKAAMASIGEIAGEVVLSATAKLIGIEPGDAAVKAALEAATEAGSQDGGGA